MSLNPAHRRFRFRLKGALAALMLLVFTVSPCMSQPSPARPEDAKRIHITADKLLTDHHRKIAEFIGNVHARQNDTTIQADHMTVFYRSQTTGDEQQQGEIGAQSIEKIVTEGNVTITMPEATGISSHAVYMSKDRTLILSGPGSRLISGENTISGAKIILNRFDGTITVESGDEERVEAVIFSEDSGL